MTTSTLNEKGVLKNFEAAKLYKSEGVIVLCTLDSSHEEEYFIGVVARLISRHSQDRIGKYDICFRKNIFTPFHGQLPPMS